ncbi:MAG: hypothetical protein V4662_03630 [Verrucomicrobiota bacterium]
MKAKMFHFQLGQTNLGWPAKILLALIIALGVVFLIFFGLIAVVVGGVALLTLKIARALRPASAESTEAPADPGLSWDRPAVEVAGELREDQGIIRDVEVEILPVEENRPVPVHEKAVPGS